VLLKSKTDDAVISFVGNLTYFLILIFAVLAALAKFGIQTASFVAILGAAGFAVGFALQGSLANFAAGVLILVLRPFRTGDYIEGAGTAGTVKEIQLFTTELATPDNVKILVPNGKLFGDIIKNYAGYDTRRVDLVVGIGYGSPIGKAVELLEELTKKWMTLDDAQRVLKGRDNEATLWISRTRPGTGS
jgi:small conductance mechanosensitive channel